MKTEIAKCKMQKLYKLQFSSSVVPSSSDFYDAEKKRNLELLMLQLPWLYLRVLCIANRQFLRVPRRFRTVVCTRSRFQQEGSRRDAETRREEHSSSLIRMSEHSGTTDTPFENSASLRLCVRFFELDDGEGLALVPANGRAMGICDFCGRELSDRAACVFCRKIGSWNL